MPILYTFNGELLVSGSELASGSSCCCGSGDGPGGCDRTKVGCCCFGTGSVTGVDECDCATMQGTFRTNCGDCQTTDGGNGGEEGDTDDSSDPPPGKCNICRTLTVGYSKKNKTWHTSYSLCSCYDYDFNPPVYVGPSTCGNEACDILLGDGIGMPRNYPSYCSILANCTMDLTPTGTLSYGCVDTGSPPGQPNDCNYTDCVAPCGLINDAYSVVTYSLSSKRCCRVNSTTFTPFESTSATSPGSETNCTLNDWTDVIVRQKVGRVSSGTVVNRTQRTQYRAEMRGGCSQKITGSDSTAFTSTC